jgi:hypothetical protein
MTQKPDLDHTPIGGRVPPEHHQGHPSWVSAPPAGSPTGTETSPLVSSPLERLPGVVSNEHLASRAMGEGFFSPQHEPAPKAPPPLPADYPETYPGGGQAQPHAAPIKSRG